MAGFQINWPLPLIYPADYLNFRVKSEQNPIFEDFSCVRTPKMVNFWLDKIVCFITKSPPPAPGLTFWVLSNETNHLNFWDWDHHWNAKNLKNFFVKTGHFWPKMTKNRIFQKCSKTPKNTFLTRFKLLKHVFKRFWVI